MLKNMFKHFMTITKHRWKVFILCIRAGAPIRGLLHDLSKYSPQEFLEGAKYYKGHISPIVACRKELGYSKAWLHHKGRNKHHHEYWYDYNSPNQIPLMPYKYFVEMVCDNIAASMVYRGKDFNDSSMLEYFNKVKGTVKRSKGMEKGLEKLYIEMKKKGYKNALNRRKLKEIYAFIEEEAVKE